MLRTPIPRTLGVPPVVAGGLALGAGAALLWLQRKAHEKAMESVRFDRTFRADALYRRPNYKGMTSQQLNAAAGLLDRWGRDVYQDPLTGTLIERRAVDAERLKRAGGGGFIFIPPPVSAPVISPAVAWAIGGLIAGGVKLAKGLAQFWGTQKQLQGAPEPGIVYLEGPLRSPNGNHLRVCRAWNASCPTEVFYEYIDTRYANPRESNGVTVYDVWTRYRLFNGSLVDRKWTAASTMETILEKKVVIRPGEVAEGSAPSEPTVLVPGTVPEIQPEVDPLPAIPAKPLAPPVTPTPAPEPEPDVVPVEPGPTAPPIVVPVPVPGRPSPPPPPTPGKVIVVRPDGTLPQLPPAEAPTTPPDWHFPIPGAPPVVGNGPQATPGEMAKELGRLEAKLNALLNPTQDLFPSWQQLLVMILEAIYYSTQGTAYTLTEPCTLEPGETPRTITVDAPGGLTSFMVIQNRLDAIAQLLQAHKDLRQPTCSVKPVLTGEWVSVSFLSDEVSVAGERRLRKVLRYRDQTFADQEAHVSHWEQFFWEAGPVCVISKGLPWGTPQVWAATAAEGKRVLAHAAQVAGVDLTDPRHEWVVTGSNDPRVGQPGTMRVDTRKGRFVRVTKRPGSNGMPLGRPPAP